MEQEIEPWIVLIGDNQVAFWQLSQPEAAALALFSTHDKAMAYLQDLKQSDCRVRQPSRRELVALMISCYQQQIVYAVLDPIGTSASRIFQLRDVLKSASSAMKAELRREV